MDTRILEYFKIAGKGEDYEITVPHLDQYLVHKYSDQEIIGGKLLEKLDQYEKSGLILQKEGSKIGLSQKGKQSL